MKPSFLILSLLSLSLSHSWAANNFEELVKEINQFYPQKNLDQCLKLAKAYQAKESEKKKHNQLLHKLYQERGEHRFIHFDVAGSVKDFERVIHISPQMKPYHWQLGISYYLNDQFQLGKDLFELHKKVNPNDVENAVWHFICNTQLVGFEAAQKALIPIQNDGRIPMMDIYELFSGRMSLKQFMKNIPDYQKVDSPRTTSMMYTYQYLGLYFEALGEKEKAKNYTLKSIESYLSYKRKHYMGDTARTQAHVRKWLP